MAAFSSTDLVALIPDLWIPPVLEQFFNARVLANFCTDLTPFLSEGGSTFELPDIFTNAFTVFTQSTQFTDVTTSNLSDPTSIKVQLAVNTHKGIAYGLGDKDARQLANNIYDYTAIYSRKAGRTLADALDAAIAALWSSVTTNVVGTTSAAITDLQIRQSMDKLDKTFYPLSELAWFFHPDVFWTQVIAIQKYYDVGQLGRPPKVDMSVVMGGGIGEEGSGSGERGNKGFLYNVPVFTSANVVNNLTSYRNLLLHKDAFMYGVQTPGDEHVRIQADYMLKNIGLLTVADIIYGTVAARQAGAVLLNGSVTATTA